MSKIIFKVFFQSGFYVDSDHVDGKIIYCLVGLLC